VAHSFAIQLIPAGLMFIVSSSFGSPSWLMSRGSVQGPQEPLLDRKLDTNDVYMLEEVSAIDGSRTPACHCRLGFCNRLKPSSTTQSLYDSSSVVPSSSGRILRNQRHQLLLPPQSSNHRIRAQIHLSSPLASSHRQSTCNYYLALLLIDNLGRRNLLMFVHSACSLSTTLALTSRSQTQQPPTEIITSGGISARHSSTSGQSSTHLLERHTLGLQLRDVPKTCDPGQAFAAPRIGCLTSSSLASLPMFTAMATGVLLLRLSHALLYRLRILLAA